ncbi:hypothetical protein DXD29_08260 [Bifidobacterium pseudocatenulatum]|nr:hypothetical protein DXD29_08260 [Bifidobacterium pseudocatenulatum]RHG96461.1 hypothetical protein DW232_08880 [Bifidobacterium pseudocatenulatum]
MVHEPLVAALDHADLLQPRERAEHRRVRFADGIGDRAGVFPRVPAVLVRLVGEADEDHPRGDVAADRRLVDGP